jgi:hypothetical protein
MAHMERDTDIDNLKLIVRALHQDVSTLDERLQILEQEIRRLHERLAPSDLIVIPSRRQARGA